MVPITFFDGVFDQAKIESVFIWLICGDISPVYQRFKKAMTFQGATVSIGCTAVALSLGDDNCVIVSHDICVMSGNKGTNVFSTRIRNSQIGFVKKFWEEAMFRYAPLDYLVEHLGKIGLD